MKTPVNAARIFIDLLEQMERAEDHVKEATKGEASMTPYDWVVTVQDNVKYAVSTEMLEWTETFRREMLNAAALCLLAVEAHDKATGRWKKYS